MPQDKLTIQDWAAELNGRRLTMAEAQLFATIATADRLVEIKQTQEQIEARLRLLDSFLTDKFGQDGYRSPEHLRALTEATE